MPDLAHAIIDYNALLPDGFLPTAEQVVVRVDGVRLRVLRYSHCDVPFYLVHASLPAEAEHEVALSIKRHHGDLQVYPKRLQTSITPQQGKQPASFRITGNPYVVVECAGLGYLLLAFEPPMPEPHGPGVIQAADLGITPTPGVLQTDALQKALDRVSADPDLHTLVLPAGWYRAGDLHLRANCRLHLAAGAVLQASDQAADIGDPAHGGFHQRRAAFINALQVDNIAITGHGHIDGNRQVLDNQGYYRDMLSLKGCHGLRIEGPVLSSSCNWNTHLRGCEDVQVHRVKVLNNRPQIGFINTDGINPDCCRRVTISHCLLHTGDDAVAVKSCAGDDGFLQDVADITVSDILAINNSATAKIGTETHAPRMQRIRFERIDAVRTARLCVVDGFDCAAITDVAFYDMQVHHLDRSRPGSESDGRIIDIHASAPTWRTIMGRSRIEQVSFHHISSDQAGRILMVGLNDEFGVRQVHLENIRIAGKAITLANIERNEFVQDISLSAEA